MGIWKQIKNGLWGPFINNKDKHEKAMVVNKINVQTIDRTSQDIQKWRLALKYAESTTQQRYRLYDLYHDMLLDGFLHNVISKRIQSITNRKLCFAVEGEEIPELSEMVEKNFFEAFLRHVMETRFWGHSLIELGWPAAGTDQKGWTELVNRKHVKPRFGIVTKHQWDVVGLPYREEPVSDHTIEVGGDEDLGLLLQVCQYVIYKRGMFGDWAEFAEVFGMPFRWATYNNEQTRKVLEEAMETAGSNGYIVAPEDADLKFLNPMASTGTGNIFKFLRDACNDEIAITILGNTMTTTEAASSGYAQSQTHMQSQQEVHMDDRQFVLRVLNEKLTPYLARMGYPVEGGLWYFQDEEGMHLKDRLEIDLKLFGLVDIPESYWYEKYKLPKPSNEDPATERRNSQPSNDEGEKKKD
jgi:hypothetical protein